MNPFVRVCCFFFRLFCVFFYIIEYDMCWARTTTFTAWERNLLKQTLQSLKHPQFATCCIWNHYKQQVEADQGPIPESRFSEQLWVEVFCSRNV